MLPLYRSLKDRLLNEPAFFLSAVAAVAGLLLSQLAGAPDSVQVGLTLLAGLGTRQLVKPEAKLIRDPEGRVVAAQD
jgi:hypothetical protein